MHQTSISVLLWQPRSHSQIGGSLRCAQLGSYLILPATLPEKPPSRFLTPLHRTVVIHQCISFRMGVYNLSNLQVCKVIAPIPTCSCWCYNNLIIIVSLIVSLYLLYPYANIIFISHYFILVCACAIQDRLLLIPVPLASFMFPCRGWYWSAITHIQTLAWASIYLDITDGNPSMYLSIVIGYPLCTPELSSSLHFEWASSWRTYCEPDNVSKPRP